MEENFLEQTKKSCEILCYQYQWITMHNSNLFATLLKAVIWFITNLYLVFVPTSGIELLNAWNFLNDECDKGIFSHVNKVTFGNTKDGDLSPEGPALSLEGQNLQPYHPDPQGGERGWRLNPLPMANDLINYGYVMKPL